MSNYIDLDVTCSDCGDEYKATVWTAIHAAQDPELKDLLLGGELNLSRCPSCGHVTYTDHFLLYQEPAAELIAYVYPENEREQEADLRKMMMAGFREAQEVYAQKDRYPYEPILIFGLETLIEMLEGENALAEQSQIAQELCKEQGLPLTLLKPSKARQLHTMRVLPGVKNGKALSRKDVLEGIDKLLALNPALDLYIKLKQTIEADSEWAVDTLVQS